MPDPKVPQQFLMFAEMNRQAYLEDAESEEDLKRRQCELKQCGDCSNCWMCQKCATCDSREICFLREMRDRMQK